MSEYIKYKATKVLQEDGSYSPTIVNGCDAENVIFEDNDNLTQKINKKSKKSIYTPYGIFFTNNRITTRKEDISGYCVEGISNTVLDSYAHVEGEDNIGYLGVHVEGKENSSDSESMYLHEEGSQNTGDKGSHVEGFNNDNGQYSHMEGFNNQGSLSDPTCVSHIVGLNNQGHLISTIIGRNNTDSLLDSDYSFIAGKYGQGEGVKTIGGGSSNSTRNIVKIDRDGNAEFSGSLEAKEINFTLIPTDSEGIPITNYVKTIFQKRNSELHFIRGNGAIQAYDLKKLVPTINNHVIIGGKQIGNQIIFEERIESLSPKVNDGLGYLEVFFYTNKKVIASLEMTLDNILVNGNEYKETFNTTGNCCLTYNFVLPIPPFQKHDFKAILTFLGADETLENLGSSILVYGCNII